MEDKTLKELENELIELNNYMDVELNKPMSKEMHTEMLCSLLDVRDEILRDIKNIINKSK